MAENLKHSSTYDVASVFLFQDVAVHVLEADRRALWLNSSPGRYDGFETPSCQPLYLKFHTFLGCGRQRTVT